MSLSPFKAAIAPRILDGASFRVPESEGDRGGNVVKLILELFDRGLEGEILFCSREDDRLGTLFRLGGTTWLKRQISSPKDVFQATDNIL